MASTLTAVPATAQDGSADPPAAEASTEPDLIDLPVPSTAERDPVPVETDLNSIADPDEVRPTFGAGTSPTELIADAVLDPEAGSSTMDAYAVDEEAGTHLAVVYPDVVNEQEGGEWIDAPLEPVPSDYGWRIESPGAPGDLPAVLDPVTPVRFHVGGGIIESIPRGVTGASGATDGSSVTYLGALPGTDLVYNPVPGGVKEELILSSPEAGLRFDWDLQTTDLTLAVTGAGTISIADASGSLVGRTATPIVYDSSEQARILTGTWMLTDLGTGAYSLGLQIDTAWAQASAYPLVIDPSTWQQGPSHDAYVNSGKKTTNYGGAATLEIGSAYHSFIRFPTGWQQPGRVIYSAKVWLKNQSQTDSSALQVRRPSATWAQGTIKWNNQPAVSATPLVQDVTGPTGGWWSVGAGGLYQDYNDALYTDAGIRLSGARKTFTSGEGATGDRPYLLISFNDPPVAPMAASPATGAVFEGLRPTLAVSSIPADANGDDVLVNYEVTSVQGQWTGGAVSASGWTDEQTFRVPAGWLTDGGTYWWRVRSADVCTPPSGLCDDQDARGTVHPWNASGERSLTISTKNRGVDDRYAMFTRQTGNGMHLSVNEANGNLVVQVPVASVATQLGRLAVGLTYNSQTDAEGKDRGLGPGWVLHAGPDSGSAQIPVDLEALPGRIVLTYRSGRTEEIPARSAKVYADVGGGPVITESSSGFTMRSSDGDVYAFDLQGQLQEARPVGSKPTVAAVNGFYAYAHDASGHLTSVTDPLGKQITFTWTGGDLTAIEVFGTARHYTLSYVGGSLRELTNPENETIRFYDTEFCNGDDLLTEVRDGDQVYDARPGWQIRHVFDQGANDADFHVCRVQKVYPPQAASGTQHYLLDYGSGGYKGFTSLTTFLTDPRGTATSGAVDDHETRVDFNTAGLPIRAEAPKAQPASDPQDWVATMVWNDREQLVCTRSPQANAISYGCTATDTTNQYNTELEYETTEPYRTSRVFEPAPSAGAARMRSTYEYDAAYTFQGLWAEQFEDQNLAGIPDDERIWSDLYRTWTSAGAPAGISGGDSWSVRLSGMLDVTAPAGGIKKEFQVIADDGVALAISGKVLLDCFASTGEQTNCGQSAPVTQVLYDGLRPITIEFRDVSDAAKLQVRWRDAGTGQAFTTIAASALLPNLGLLTGQNRKPDPGGNALAIETTWGYPSDDDKWRRLPASVTRTDLGTGRFRKVTYTYDDYGRRLSFTRFASSPDNITYTRDYTGACLTTITDPTGAWTTFACNTVGDRTQVSQHLRPVSADGGATTLQADQDRITSTAYDLIGRPTRVDLPLSGASTFTYDRSGRIKTTATLLDPAPGERFATSTFTYDDTATNPTITEQAEDPDEPDVADGDTPVITRTFDWVGNEIATTDPRNAAWVTTTDYDAQNRVKTVTSPDPDGTGTLPPLVTSTDYALDVTDGAMTVTVTGPDGVASTATTDVVGRQIRSQAGDLAASTSTYDDAGHLIRTQTGTGAGATFTEYDHDAFGKVTQMRTPWSSAGAVSEETTTYTYDPDTGWLQSLDGPLLTHTVHKDVIDYERDELGRLTGVTMWFKDDGDGYVDSMEEAAITTITRNDAGERVRVRSELSATKAQVRDYVRNARGQVVSITEYHGTSSGAYDQAGAQIQDVTWSIAYAPAGWRVRSTYPDGLVMHTERDDLGRVTRRYETGWPGIDETTMSYLKDGSVALLTGPDDITWDHGYDRVGRLTSLAGSSTTSWVYNDSGQLQSLTADGLTTSYVYAGSTDTSQGKYEGLMRTFTDPVSAKTWTYAYDAFGRATSRTAPGAPSFTRTYEDATGRVDTQTVGVVAGTLAFFDLDYDRAGDITRREQKLWYGAPTTGPPSSTAGSTGTGVFTYDYDGSGRLLTASGPSPTGTRDYVYAYDGLGNRTSETIDGQVTTSTTDKQGWVVSVNPPGASNTQDLRYSPRGAITLIDDTSAANLDTGFSYDAWGRTIAATLGSTDVTYEIDAFGRTASRTQGTTTDLVYAGDSEDLVRQGTTTYGWGPSGPVASAESGAASFLVSDLHGDVVASSSAGVLTAATWYSPYGEPESLETETGTLGYQGQYTDETTGAVDMLTRWYLPELGRFTTRDKLFGKPNDPMSLNQFAYVGANPVTLTDSTGLECDPSPSPDICTTPNPIPPPTPLPQVESTTPELAPTPDADGPGPQNVPTATPIPTPDVATYELCQVMNCHTPSFWGVFGDPALNFLQLMLAVCGGVPVAGDLACDTTDGAISAARGDMFGAGLDAAGAAIGIGVAADGADILRSGKRFVGLGEHVLDASLSAALTVGRNADSGVDVYLGVKNGEAVYVGITNDLARRAAQHGGRFDTLDLVTTSSVTRGQARAIEEALLQRNPGFTNLIHSLSPRRPFYSEAVAWGEQWLRSQGL